MQAAARLCLQALKQAPVPQPFGRPKENFRVCPYIFASGGNNRHNDRWRRDSFSLIWRMTGFSRVAVSKLTSINVHNRRPDSNLPGGLR
jgi:hypothetical protein